MFKLIALATFTYSSGLFIIVSLDILLEAG